MRKLKLFLSMLMLIAFSVGNVWGADPSVKSTFSTSSTVTDNKVTENGVTWTLDVTVAAGTPTITTGTANQIQGLKFGSSGSNYYSPIKFSTDYFKDYNVKSVTIYEKNNGSKKGTLTVKQGSVTIGTKSHSSNTSAWGTLTASGTTGAGGTLEVTYEVAQASYFNYIEVVYEEGGTTCTSEITITKADDPANGTFELSDEGAVCIDGGNATITVTASPDTHYHLASVTSTVGTIGTISGNTCEITDIDADTEIGVTFAEDTKYVVTWNVNGNEDTKTNVYASEKPVFPATPAACDATSTTFIGWATAPWTGKLADLSEKTVYTSASAMPDVDAAVTYYAVFAKSSGSASELFSWAGGTKAELEAAEGVAALNADNSDYAESNAPYRVKWNGTGKYIIISVASQPGKVSAGFKMIGGATTSTITVQEADDAEGPFTDVENLAISGSSNDVVNIESTQAFKSTTRAIKLYYTKGSNVGLGPISIEGAVSYSDYMTTCCTQYNVNIAAGIENGSVSADVAKACEGATVTLTFTPATNYHLSAWTLNGVAQDVNANTFSMPAGAATISATFEQDACDPLATPVVTVSGKAYPYDAVKLAWSAIDNADAYKVYIYDNEDNELEHNDAVTGVEYTIGQALSASTTYKYSVQAISNTPATYCPSEAATGSFVTEALPTAHLTLIALGEEQQASGDYSILTPFALPNTAASCAKTFMGWDANSECASAPTYAKGAEFTFQNTTGVTLYAVYADETPGEATLTKLGSNYAPTAGDKLVIVGVDGDDQYALYRETQSSSYVKNWAFDNNVATVAADAKKYVILEAATNGKFYLGDATNGYVYSSGSNNLSVDASNKTEWTIAWDNNASAFTFSQGKYLSCRSDLSGANQYLYRLAGGTPAGIYKLDVYKYATSASTYDNYSTTCVAAPTATPASASIEVAAAGGSSTLGVTYENVNLAGVTVALYNNEACTEAFDGGWLTASIAGDDKHIAYIAQANTSYNDARTAYIKLTAPETNGAANPAVVVIPVEQARKPAVFASLAELVAANVNSGIQVTVSFEEVITNDQTISGPKRAGLFLTTTAGSNSKAIEIFYNKGTTAVPAEWVIGGKLAATSMTFTWTLFNSDQWELVPLGNDWTWDNGDLTYTAPKAVSSVVVSGEPTKKAYVDGELFKPAGLTVTVNYTVGEPEVNPVGVTFACTPERVAKGNTSVEVVATFNEVDSDPFEVTGLTVGDIQLMSIADFIDAGGARCYLKGVVGTIDNNTYGNFNLTDASGTIYVYGCLTPAGESGKFNTLGVSAGDKIKVIAEEYLLYGSPAYDEAKNVVFVSKKPVATMTFDPMAMETGDVETIAPKTITEAEASAVVYSIKAGSDDCVELDGAQITATAPGSATIVATLTEAADYMGTTVEFAVTVTAPDTRKIANASAFEAISGDMTPTDIAFAAYKGDGTNAPVLRSSDNPVAIRLYKPATTGGTGNYLTLTAKVGCTIDQVQITFSGNADAAYCKDDEALPTEKYITSETVLLTSAGLNAQSVSIVNLKNGSIDVNAIKVWYNGEPLAIDHYFVDATGATTEFVQYSTFDYTGLKVYAAYDELETITEEISGFTATADLMTAGDKKAKVYLNEVEIAEYDITVTASSKQNPALAYDPTSDEITLGDAWTAPTLDNPLNVEGISFSSNNTSVAKVSAAGVITLQGGCGEATITASFAETDDYVASSATYTITVNEPAEILGGKWELVNEILPGMRIIIANEASNGAVKTMGGQNSNNRAAVASTVDGEGVLTPAAGTKTFLVVTTDTEDQYALQARNGKYIYAASNSSNNMKEQNNIDDNAKWSFSFSENVATITANGSNSHNVIRYNSQSNIFSCYAGGQSDVYVYAWKPYTRNVSGNYGTICLPKAGVMTNGVLYEISYYDADQKKIFFDEVEGGVMVAGAPYIFKPNENVTELKVAYTDVAVVDNAGHKNGLYGHYDLNNPTEGAEAARLFLTNGDYFLRNNEYWLVDQEDRVYVDNYRAYIKLDKIGNDVPPQAYGRRRVAMNVNGEQVATGFENLNASEKPVKLMIDGNIYILRGEKLYDTTGRLVK